MRKILKKVSGIAIALVFMMGIVVSMSNVKAATRNIYFVWLDGSNNFHYHKLTGILTSDTGETNYVSVATLKDDNDASVTYAMGQSYEFVKEADLDGVLADPTEFNAASNKLEWLHDHDKTIDPAGGAKTAHSFTTNGDMDFRITVYDQYYIAAKVGVAGANNYEPDFAGGLFIDSTYDVSGGTSASKPAVVKSYLLNDTVTLQGSDLSGQFASVTALDVPPGAVEVHKEGNVFIIEFKSNFYDRVVFQVKTTDNKTAYVMVARLALYLDRAEDRGPGRDRSVRPTLYYSKANSYQDWQLVANITYKSGKKEVRLLNPVLNGINDMNTDPFTNEMDGDIDMSVRTSQPTKMKKCQFLLADAKQMKEIKLTVIKKGALTADTYTGTFTGSGDGLVYREVSVHGGRDTAKEVIYYEGQVFE